MKKALIATLGVSIILGTILVYPANTAYAEGYRGYDSYEEYVDAWIKKQEDAARKHLDDLYEDGNLTQEAIDASMLDDYDKEPNNKSDRKNNSKNSTGTGSSSGYASGSSGQGTGKGWVYSCDELHVVGLPAGEDGYTLPGWYGDID